MAGRSGTPVRQLILNMPDFSRMIRRFDIWTDYGPITTGSGASQPHYVATENGSEYLIKGASLTPAEPYVAANELVSALIANFLQLPILDFGLAEDIRGNLFFASSYLSGGMFHPVLTEPLLDDCQNRERIYNIVPFDIWLWNTDRHSGNFLVRDDRRGSRFLLLNDHSRCLVQPSETPASLLTRATHGNISIFLGTPFVQDRITDPRLLSDGITAIEDIQDATIQTLEHVIPDKLLDASEKQDVIQFLMERKLALRSLIQAERHIFGRLGSGLI